MGISTIDRVRKNGKRVAQPPGCAPMTSAVGADESNSMSRRSAIQSSFRIADGAANPRAPQVDR
jgi:hypothetical protein